ncbi:MAG: hypothetical protein U0W24_12525 [Bacteroidales bacterium]
MKTTILFLFITVLLSVNAFAQNEPENKQPQSLLGGDSKITGWFVSIDNSFSRLHDKNVNMPGFSFGMNMNRTFQLGLTGKSFSWYETSLKYDDLYDEPCYLTGGYGGMYFNIVPQSGKVLHVSIPVIIGGGTADYITVAEYPETDDGEIEMERRKLEQIPFFAFEPGVNLEMNITGFMKIYSGVSYRLLSGANLSSQSKNGLNGLNIKLGIQFGKF